MGSKAKKQDKVFTAEITVNRTVQHYTEDSYDQARMNTHLESNELTTMTLKATSLKVLIDKINAHTALLSEE